MRALALLVLLVGACGRSEPTSVLAIEAVTTDALPTATTRRLDVSVLLTNSGDTDLTVARVGVVIDPADSTVRAVPDPRNPTLLPAQSDLTFAFDITLPAAWTGLRIDAEAVAVDEAAGRVHRATGADSPLVLSAETSTPSTDLVVTVADDELDGGAALASVSGAGGAADLSLREAVTIANNRAGADWIAFDAGAFPVTAPTLITLDVTSSLVELTDEETTIDGSGAGVAITVTGGDGPALRVRGHRSVVRGLELRDCCEGIHIVDAGEVIVEECVISTPSDAADCITFDTRTLQMSNATAASIINNQFMSLDACVTIGATSGARVAGNHCSAGGAGFRHSDSFDCIIEDNDFSVASWAWFVHQSQNNQFLNNRIARAGGGCVSLHDATDGTLIANNLLNACGDSGNEYAIRVTEGGRYNTFTRNNIDDGEAAIYIETGAQEGVTPPVVDTVAAAEVRGTSSAPAGSVIEVFHDSSARAEVYIGTTTVDSGGAWVVALAEPVPSGRTVTATVTTPNGSTSELATHLPVP